MFDFLKSKKSISDNNKSMEEIYLRWGPGNDVSSDAATKTRSITVSTTRVLTRIKRTVKKFVTQVIRGGFEDPEWDFSEVEKAIFKESLLRRAFEKYVEQMWKNGFEFTGKNLNTVQYIRKRFKQIAQVSGISTLQLFQQMAFSLVAYNNIICVKKRNINASGGRPRVTFYGKELDPIAAYFVISPVTIEVDKDDYGNVKKWRQKDDNFNSFGVLRNVNSREWFTEDIVFVRDSTATDTFYFFAMPMAIPVLNDIKALRETEELAILQAVKFAIPRYHGKVGTKDKPGLDPEIQRVASDIDSLPTDAVLITSNRVEIKSISEGDQTLDLSPYLKYWWDRILAGLGMSSVGFGDGETSSKSTAQVMIAEMQNTTIKFQQILKDGIEETMIRELLMELGHTEETITEDNMVYLHIPEIDLENKIKKDNHVIELWNNNLITHDEARIELGKDKLPDSERKKLFNEMIQLPAIEKKMEASRNSVSNKDRPANQNGKLKAKPKIAKTDMDDGFDLFAAEFLDYHGN